MKNRNYKVILTLVIILSAMNARSEVITGISDPFQFGTPLQPPLEVPFGPLAYIISAGLIGLYTYWRSYRFGRKENSL